MRRLRNQLLFVRAIMAANWAAAAEYRGSFLTQVFGMMVNDAMWVVFSGSARSRRRPRP